MTERTAGAIKAIIDANRAFFGREDDTNLQDDGFPPTSTIENRLLAAPQIPNPNPRGNVPTHYRLDDEDFGRLFGMTRGLAMVDWLNAHQPTLLSWLRGKGIGLSHPETATDLAGLVQAGGLTREEADTILALGSEPDPNWSEKVDGKSKLQEAGFENDAVGLKELINSALSRLENKESAQ